MNWTHSNQMRDILLDFSHNKKTTEEKNKTEQQNGCAHTHWQIKRHHLIRLDRLI